jgi:hypothetical protein
MAPFPQELEKLGTDNQVAGGVGVTERFKRHVERNAQGWHRMVVNIEGAGTGRVPSPPPFATITPSGGPSGDRIPFRNAIAI